MREITVADLIEAEAKKFAKDTFCKIILAQEAGRLFWGLYSRCNFEEFLAATQEEHDYDLEDIRRVMHVYLAYRPVAGQGKTAIWDACADITGVQEPNQSYSKLPKLNYRKSANASDPDSLESTFKNEMDELLKKTPGIVSASTGNNKNYPDHEPIH